MERMITISTNSGLKKAKTIEKRKLWQGLTQTDLPDLEKTFRFPNRKLT